MSQAARADRAACLLTRLSRSHGKPTGRKFQIDPLPELSPWWLLPLLVSPAAAQQVDTANSPNSPGRTLSVFDEIQDAQERGLFKELWDTKDPQQGRQRVVDFVERYPRSVVLREAYEQAARASAVLGDDNAALEWGKRAAAAAGESISADNDGRSGGAARPAPVSGDERPAGAAVLGASAGAGGNFARCLAAGAGRSAESGGFRSWPHSGGGRLCRALCARRRVK
jgi:hypothetical protein